MGEFTNLGAIEDEQMVNTALLLYLNVLTMYHLGDVERPFLEALLHCGHRLGTGAKTRHSKPGLIATSVVAGRDEH